jgi:hypothetical protein
VTLSCPHTLRAGDAERVREVPSNPNHVSTVERKDREPGPYPRSSVRVYQNFPGPNDGWVTATAAAAVRSSTTPSARDALAGELPVGVEGAPPVVPHPDRAATTQTNETIDPLDTPRSRS